MKTKKIIIVTASVILVLVLVTLANFIPTLSLETSGMQEIKGEWITLYCENEKEAAEDVFCFAESESERIAEKLGFTEKQNIKIYIYDSQKTMQTKKYGFIAPLLGLDWYIGDNIGTDVIVTSPANPGKYHSYQSIKAAIPHEITHAYVSVMNENISLWLTEGVALYLTNGEPFYREMLEYMSVPSYKATQTNNPIAFSECGGYTFAQTYIEYLDKEYGWDNVLKLIEKEDYITCFGKTESEIYSEWLQYLQNYYQ